MINPELVFDSVRRGYNQFEQASNDEIVAYFDAVDPDSMGGHISNIKGILFEQVYVDQLSEQGVEASVFAATNHPGVDVSVFDDSGLATELQLKATDSVAYINTTLADNPDITIVATSEVASGMNNELVINSGIEDVALENAVSETLLDEAISPVNPLSMVGWLFGLPF